MKLALGTVQFGMPYGINNLTGVPSDDELTAIFDYAETCGITLIDTAVAYGDAEKRIGSRLHGRFKVVSKFPVLESPEELAAYCRRSCELLQTPTLYGYLAHNAKELIGNPQLWEKLQQLIGEGLIAGAGVSLYHPNELETLLESGIVPHLIQVPYSLLDRKFEPLFAELKNRNIEIHTRSAFLQGLYFKDPATLAGKLSALRPALETLHRIAAENNCSMESLALRFATRHPLVDYVVIGVDSLQQLASNVISLRECTVSDNVFDEIRELVIPDPELLNPATWQA
jgi:aryl-alcohol dehydrogenase-like predicted oxidoreductase